MSRPNRKTKIGTIVSTKNEKTATVAVTRQYRHPLYGKTISRTKKYLAHDEKNNAQLGDTVEIMETRPLSKRKCWRITQTLQKS